MKSEESSARSRDDKMLLLVDDIKGSYQDHIERELDKVHTLVRELRVAVDGQVEHSDFISAQFTDLVRGKERPVNRAELETMEKRLLTMLAPSLEAVTELQQTFGESRLGAEFGVVSFLMIFLKCLYVFFSREGVAKCSRSTDGKWRS